MTQFPFNSTSLVLKETIKASPERLFAFWTEPQHILAWFGPESVTCVGAEVDLKVGGQYRIGNRFPDGKTSWIAGTFEAIEKPSRLVYSWGLEPASPTERVTVQFNPSGDFTEVIVTHENIPDEKIREGHEKGWDGCLKGLIEYVEKTPRL